MIHLITLPNDTNAKIFADNLRKGGFKVRFRGRGYRYGKSNGGCYQSHIPLSLAQKVAVYVGGGPFDHWNKQINTAVGEKISAEYRARIAEEKLTNLRGRFDTVQFNALTSP